MAENLLFCSNIQFGIYSLAFIVLILSYINLQKYVFIFTLISSIVTIMFNSLLSVHQDKSYHEFIKIFNFIQMLNLNWNLALSLILMYNKKELENKTPKLSNECVESIKEIVGQNLDEKTQRVLIRTINKHLILDSHES